MQFPQEIIFGSLSGLRRSKDPVSLLLQVRDIAYEKFCLQIYFCMKFLRCRKPEEWKIDDNKEHL